MRIAKSRKHEKVQARKRVKAWIKTHSITSRNTFNRRARVIMDKVIMEEIDTSYVIIDGVAYTYVTEWKI